MKNLFVLLLAFLIPASVFGSRLTPITLSEATLGGGNQTSILLSDERIVVDYKYRKIVRTRAEDEYYPNTADNVIRVTIGKDVSFYRIEGKASYLISAEVSSELTRNDVIVFSISFSVNSDSRNNGYEDKISSYLVYCKGKFTPVEEIYLPGQSYAYENFNKVQFRDVNGYWALQFADMHVVEDIFSMRAKIVSFEEFYQGKTSPRPKTLFSISYEETYDWPQFASNSIVNDNNVRLRKEPSLSGPIIKVLKKNTQLFPQQNLPIFDEVNSKLGCWISVSLSEDGQDSENEWIWCEFFTHKKVEKES